MEKCCIIYNEPLPGALEDELDVLDQVAHIEEHLLELGIGVYRKGITANFMAEIAELKSEKPDFVFNLVESIDNKGELNYFVPALLNMNSIPYSGNSHEAIFLTTNKIIASKMMKDAGITCPASYKPSQLNLLKPGSRYIIKPIWECAPGFEEKLKGKDDAHWFIEDFVDGREYNMSILAGESGPEVLPPAEIVFRDYGDSRPKIVDFKAKWEMDTFEYVNTVREFPGSSLEPQYVEKLKKAARECWHLFGLKGYARVDARADSNGNIFIIEINANPCISPDGGFVAATRQAGYQFKTVLQRIIGDLN